MKSTNNHGYERAIQAIKSGRASDSSWTNESRSQLRDTITNATNGEYSISFYNTKDNDCGIQLRKNGRFIKKDDISAAVSYLESQLNNYSSQQSKVVDIKQGRGFADRINSVAANARLYIAAAGAGIALSLLAGFYSGYRSGSNRSEAELNQANSTIQLYSHQLSQAKAKNKELAKSNNKLNNQTVKVKNRYSIDLARLIECEAKEQEVIRERPLTTNPNHDSDQKSATLLAYEATKKAMGGKDLSKIPTTADIHILPQKNFGPRQGPARPDTYDSILDPIRARHVKVQEKLITHPSQSNTKTKYHLDALKGRNVFGDLDNARTAYVDEDSRFPSVNFSDAGDNVLNALWSPITALTFSQTESGKEFRKDDGNFIKPIKKAGKGFVRIPANIFGSIYSLLDTVTGDKVLPNLSGYKDMNPAIGTVRQIGRVGASAQDVVDGAINVGGYPNNFYGPLVYGSGELIESAGHASQGIANTAITLPLQAATKEDSKSRENTMIWADVIPTILDTSVHTVKLTGWEHSREGNTSGARIKEGDVRFTLENLLPYVPIALSINETLESHRHGNGKVTGGDDGSPGTGGVIGGGDGGSPGIGF